MLRSETAEWITWHAAMERALYGDDGFYRRERPAAHFRTSVHASTRFAGALARLLTEVDQRLGHPERLDVVDVGAGCGGLLVRLTAEVDPGLARRLVPVAVEVAPRPADLPRSIGWRDDLPGDITGMVIANEWLDNVPIDIVEQTPAGPRTVLVDRTTGAERHGPPPDADDRDWLERWWPLREPGERAEVGRHRCAAWSSVITATRRGLAVAIDYGHTRSARPPYGTLTGYRDGHTVTPVPDGERDITAHVALDACAAAGERAGAERTVLTSQRRALSALGVTGIRPPIDLASRDPRGYVQALCTAGEEAELIDPAGLGGFGWLVQAVGVDIPAALADCPDFAPQPRRS